MRDKILYEMAEAIVGKTNGQPIIDLLKDKKDVNEFKIADKLKMTINQARNILYKLYAHDVISFIRKKDKVKGWYIYYWTLNVIKSLEFLSRLKQKEMHEEQNILKSKENKRFYHCTGCSIELTEETALNHDFLCPECGSLLTASDNREKIIETTSKIKKIQNEISVIETELAKLKSEAYVKQNKKDARILRAKKKVKKAERAKAKKAKDKLNKPKNILKSKKKAKPNKAKAKKKVFKRKR